MLGSKFSIYQEQTTPEIFKITVKTDNAGVSANNQFTAPLESIGTYSF